jgi:hypothetical protein
MRSDYDGGAATSMLPSMRRLAIPKPCDASWGAMTPTAEGRHCARCATRVVDMTSMNAREATITASLFAPGSLCARLALSAALTTAAGCSSARPIAEPLPMSETKTTPKQKVSIDPDDDLDHIPDVNDKCPHEPETYNGFEDEDGCPDMGKVIVPPMHTERWRVLPFRDRDEGEVRSTIAQIASLLRAHPGLGVLHVRGDVHRVAKVVTMIVEHGVSRDRVRASPDDGVDATNVSLELVEG